MPGLDREVGGYDDLPDEPVTVSITVPLGRPDRARRGDFYPAVLASQALAHPLQWRAPSPGLPGAGRHRRGEARPAPPRGQQVEHRRQARGPVREAATLGVAAAGVVLVVVAALLLVVELVTGTLG